MKFDKHGSDKARDPFADYLRLFSEMSQNYMQLYGEAVRYWDRMGASTQTAASTPPASGRAPVKVPQPGNATFGSHTVAIDEPIVRDAYMDSIPLHEKRVTLSNGQQMAVPYRFWRTQALLLTGQIDADKANAILQPHQDTPVLNENGAATVHIYAPNYHGSSAGPILALFASIVVQDNHFCGRPYREDGGCLDGEFFWLYRTSSELNDRFKREVWGIHSEMASLAFDYYGPARGVALVENGKPALRMVWCNKSGHNEVVDLPGEQRFTSVTPLPKRTHRLTRFRGKRLAPRRSPGGPLAAGFPFDTTADEFELNSDTSFGNALLDAGFQPIHWNFFPDYGGVVEIPHPDDA